MPVSRSNPKLMVIGDSLAQGCRSLSVDAPRCSQCWAARFATQQGWDFVTPNHPRPVLFDLEREIRILNPIELAPQDFNLGGFVGRYLQNLDDWNHQVPASIDCFDNVAIAGATVEDLYLRTAGSSDRDINKIINNNPLNALNFNALGSLHVDVNSRYVLNPAQQAEYAEWTQLDWVEQRCPENLFVQIGHNHGLFQVGFSATVTGTPIDSITQNGGSSDSYWVQWQKLADRLAKLPEAVKQILVVRLPKVGAVGNLMPTDAARTNGYAMAYEPTLSTHPRMAGTVLASVDQAILTVNTAIEKTLLDAETAARAGKPSRVIFFDAYQFLEQLDFKNTENAALRVEVLPSVTVDNLYLDGSIRFGWPPISYQLASGGLFGVDGMHPSGVGYAALASGLMKQLGINHDRDALLQLAYHDDRLLSNYPPELDMVVNLLETLRQAINVNYFSHEPTGSITEDTHFADILRGMKSVFDPN